MVGREIGDIGYAVGHRQATVGALADADSVVPDAGIGTADHWIGARHRRPHLELRQCDAEILQEAARPRTGGEYHALRFDDPALGDHRHDLTASRLHTAHRAVGEDDGTLGPGGERDGRRGLLRLGTPVARTP